MKQIHLAFVTVIFGCALLMAGFLVPPMGEIDPTILTAFGEALTFAGAICGVDYKYRSKKDNEENS